MSEIATGPKEKDAKKEAAEKFVRENNGQPKSVEAKKSGSNGYLMIGAVTLGVGVVGYILYKNRKAISKAIYNNNDENVEKKTDPKERPPPPPPPPPTSRRIFNDD